MLRCSMLDFRSSILRHRGEDESQGVSSAAGAVFFISGGPIGRAHGTAFKLAADSRAVAHFDGAYKTSLATVIEHRRWLGGMILRTITEVLGHGRGVHYLAGIEEVMRIEGVLDLPEGVIDRVAEHFSIPLTASQAI